MTPAQVITLINDEIKANGNNDITAEVLAPVLITMVNQINDLVGNANNLPDGITNVITAINTINANKLRNYTEITSTYVVSAEDDVVVYSGEDEADILIPDPSENTKRILTIVNLSDFDITMPEKYNNLFNESLLTLQSNKALRIISDGTKWQEISNTEATTS
jgi:hypothetical protein